MVYELWRYERYERYNLGWYNDDNYMGTACLCFKTYSRERRVL